MSRLCYGIGPLLVATTLLVVLFEWSGQPTFSRLAGATTAIAIVLLVTQVSWSRRVFVLVGAGLFLAAVATLPDWPAATEAALRSASFIAAFFVALTTIRSAAAGSPSIERCGRFLADQPPGRRYLALTIGGQLFGIILMYGAISLLGSLSASSAAREPNAEIRRHRVRRMLVAIQRGFVSTLPWSPLAFAMAISTTLVPGASWEEAVLPCLVSGLVLAGLGWGLDTVFKPRLSAPPPPRATPEGSWLGRLKPLLVLLAVLVVGVAMLYVATGVRVVALVMTVVPIIALVWVAIQRRTAGDKGIGSRIRSRASSFAMADLPGNGSELVLLVMAGFIGAMGARLSAPVIAAAGIDLSAVPGWALLLGVFWLIPVAGQIGMNPILAVSLMLPLLPPPEAMGVAPATLIVAITSGWALSGATSPFTASTTLVASIGGVSAAHVGTRWNGPYAFICGLALSSWIMLVAYVL
jgi:hypothetical protein